MQKFVNAVDDMKVTNLVASKQKGISIKIGKDNEELGLEACSIISTPYYLDLNEYGTIMAVSPVRANYKKIVPIVEYLANKIPKIY